MHKGLAGCDTVAYELFQLFDFWNRPHSERDQIGIPSIHTSNTPLLPGTSPTLASMDSKMVSSSWATQAARSSHLHCMQYSISIRGRPLMRVPNYIVGLLLFAAALMPKQQFSPSRGRHEAPSQRTLSDSQVLLLLWSRASSKCKKATARHSAHRRPASSTRISGTALTGRDAKASESEDCRSRQKMFNLPRGVHGL
jgi:hypothetical protein